ncbi:hypothetical protein HYW59_03450 [Candidatus Kaiserbacteria bacterium]|nr:hypothetical protein [Candidatus Kaiserbacteria bacterium]
MDENQRVFRAAQLLNGFLKRPEPTNKRMVLAQARRCGEFCGLQIEGTIHEKYPLVLAGLIMFQAKKLEERS